MMMHRNIKNFFNSFQLPLEKQRLVLRELLLMQIIEHFLLGIVDYLCCISQIIVLQETLILILA